MAFLPLVQSDPGSAFYQRLNDWILEEYGASHV